ncbi:MAG TPA: glycosyltransferase family 39 protein [Candidatus Hydrogenedentes bacterium]|nr:glycosyltransferase family 39 protein [Candidatus Hydrogenedentota bacterium]HPG65744.1 glycosyltransferase family 39 protein [Candidatus Hydrogenedentota bacterium]
MSDKISRYAVPGAVFALTAVGALLRLYRIEAQSLWLDEFANVWNVGAPSLSMYLNLLASTSPEQAQAPAYYILQYGWAHWAGMSPPVLRLLPILIGTAAIPSAYLFGARLFNRGVGLIAAMGLALSPQNIWHAQEPRPYALLVLVATLAFYTFWRAWRDDGRVWWVLNAALNLLTLWTFLFGVLALIVQGLFLLCFVRRRFKTGFLWVLIHTAFLLPWGWALLEMAPQNDIYGSTRFSAVVNEIFFGDVVSIQPDLLPPWKTNDVEFESPETACLLRMRPAFDAALLAVTAIGFLVFLLTALLWPAWKRARKKDSAADRTTFEAALLTCLIVVVPSAVLGLGAWALKLSLMGSMYTLYRTVGLYCALGYALSRLRKQALIGIATVVLSSLYAYQLAIFLPEVTRTNWCGAAEYIQAHGGPEDLVIEVEFAGPGRFLDYYLGPYGPEVRRVGTFQAALEDAAAALHGADDARAPRPRVWLALQRLEINALGRLQRRNYDFGGNLARGLAERGLQGEGHEFFGHYNLVLYRVERDQSLTPLASPSPVPHVLPIDYEALLDELRCRCDTPEARPRGIAALRRNIVAWPPFLDFYGVTMALDILRDGNVDMAECVARKLVERNPRLGLGQFALGLILTADGRGDAASDVFREAFTHRPVLEKVYGPFVDALLVQREISIAKQEIDRIRSCGYTLYVESLEQAADGFDKGGLR